VLTADDMRAHNTFEQPAAVAPAAFEAFRQTANGFQVTLPPKSVVVLAVATGT
jgi:alpha-N-arabinofuranosidase